MVAAEEFTRNENLYKQVALQEADERRLRKEEFTRLRREWLEQTRVGTVVFDRLFAAHSQRSLTLEYESQMTHPQTVCR